MLDDKSKKTVDGGRAAGLRLLIVSSPLLAWNAPLVSIDDRDMLMTVDVAAAAAALDADIIISVTFTTTR